MYFLHHRTYFEYSANTLEAAEDMENLALLDGRDRLDIPKEFYDIWLESLIQTVAERDPEFDVKVDTTWRVVMAPGIEYKKSFCD